MTSSAVSVHCIINTQLLSHALIFSLVQLRPESTTQLCLAGSVHQPIKHRGGFMLWTLTVLLVIMWLLGMVSSYTLGGFIHILLLIAVAVVLVRIIQGRNPV